MAQFSTDFSEYSIGDDPTVDGPAEWASRWSSLTAEIKSDATHGNYVELVPGNHGGYFNAAWTAVGSGAPDCEMLILMRRGGTETSGAWVLASGAAGSEYTWRFTLRNNNTDARISNVSNGSHTQLALYQHGLSNNGAGIWLWKRCRVVDIGGTSPQEYTLFVRVWADGDPEPATWTDSVTTGIGLHSSGEFGIGGWDSGAEVARDFAWVGVGTEGDAAPSPDAFDPANLQATVDGDQVTLTWDASF